MALRTDAATRADLANGNVGTLINRINTNLLGGDNGTALRRAGYAENFIVPSPQYSIATVLGNLTNATYHAMQLQVRWPQPEFRFKHVLIQEAVYGTIVGLERRRLHGEAARWLEARAESIDDVLALLAHHWLAAADEEKAADYLMRAGDKARQEHALDEAIGHYRELLPLLERRGASQAIALVLFKLALALHTSMRFTEANDAYQRRSSNGRRPRRAPSVDRRLRLASSFLPNDPDPRSAIAWPNIQLCMQLFDRLVEAWPERTIVPSLAERWEIADDGLRYVFHLREGLTWSDGAPLTAHDVEFGIKRVLDPAAPGSSVAIYFVLENGQDYYLGRNETPTRSASARSTTAPSSSDWSRRRRTS